MIYVKLFFNYTYKLNGKDEKGLKCIYDKKSDEYKETVKNVEANTPARYNSNKSKLYESSGCSGKIAVFAARIDTFKKEESETTLYLSTNKPEDFTNFKKSVLSNLENLPIYAEYMHKDAYEAAKKYGKDAFLLIYFLGTSTMPIFYKIKTRIERYFKSSKIFNSKSARCNKNNKL